MSEQSESIFSEHGRDSKRLAEAISHLARAIDGLAGTIKNNENKAVLHRIVQMEERIMKELDDLSTEVEETRTGIDSAIVLLNGLSQLIKDAGTDPAKLKELTDSLDAKNAELAAAVVANTPAA